MNYTRYFVFLLLLMCLKAALGVFFILHAGIGLGPDEAQYWTWSQQLDWGYYSKPPGIAWQDWLGTHLFGNTELGVRAMPVVIGTLVPLLVFILARGCQLLPLTCFWAGAAMAFSPIGMMASFLSITDGGMIFFWTAACAYFVGKVGREEMPNYPLLGLLICAGALFKWPIYALWLFVVIFWWFCPRAASWRLLLGIGVSLLAMLPSIYWNASHDWVTFRHVFATVSGGHGRAGNGVVLAGNFWEFFGAQALLVSPILFVLLAMGLAALVKRRGTSTLGLLFCGEVTLIGVGFALVLALLMKMQGNWAIFAYPTAFVVISWYACERVRNGLKWLVGGVILSAVLCGITFSIPYLQSHDVLSSLPIPYRLSPFRHNVGWDRLQQELKAAGYDPEKDFLFGDKYQTASILSFYGEEQKRAYFLNLQGSRKNQFSFWPGMDKERKGKRGFFVVWENAPRLNDDLPKMVSMYESLLKPYFEQVRFLGVKPLFSAYGQIVKGALIFECTGYLGTMPQDPDLY